MTDWETGKPPPKEVVEVEHYETKEIIRVRAIWGDKDKGVLPHWEAEDRSCLYYPEAFGRWRRLDRVGELLDNPVV